MRTYMQKRIECVCAMETFDPNMWFLFSMSLNDPSLQSTQLQKIQHVLILPYRKRKEKRTFFSYLFASRKVVHRKQPPFPKISITFEPCLLYFFLYKDNYPPNSKLYLANFCILTQVNKLTNIVFKSVSAIVYV